MKYKDVRLAPGYDEEIETDKATYRFLEPQVRGSIRTPFTHIRTDLHYHPYTLHLYPNGFTCTSVHTSLTSERIYCNIRTPFTHIRTDLTDIRDCMCVRARVCVRVSACVCECVCANTVLAFDSYTESPAHAFDNFKGCNTYTPLAGQRSHPCCHWSRGGF